MGSNNDKGRNSVLLSLLSFFREPLSFPVWSGAFADGNSGLHSPDQRIRAMHDAGVSVIES